MLLDEAFDEADGLRDDDDGDDQSDQSGQNRQDDRYAFSRDVGRDFMHPFLRFRFRRQSGGGDGRKECPEHKR